MTHVAYRSAELQLRPGWRAVRIKDVTSYVNRGTAPVYTEEPTPCIAFSQKCVRQDRSVDTTLGRFAVPPDGIETCASVLRESDVVVNSTGVGTLGRAGLIPASDEDDEVTFLADGHVTIVRSIPAVCLPRYLWYVLATDVFYRFANEALSVGSTNQTELGREAIRRMAFGLPPLGEQGAILEILDDECTTISALVVELGAANVRGSLGALLEEHRQALITAAVTGGLDALQGVA